MNKLKYLITFVALALAFNVEAYKPFVPDDQAGTAGDDQPTQANYRADCAESSSFTDLGINNVRARLLGGGDMWWDLNDARYVVPNVQPGSGLPEVSAIFAGAIWLGGFDDGNNLKMAAQTYRSSTRNDFWPGPLEVGSGETTEEVCQSWDKHFEVRGEAIKTHVANFFGGAFDCDGVDVGIKGWPGRGNPYFAQVHGFELPNQSLAPFFDQDEDGLYDPCQGDYPIIEIIGCEVTEPDRVGIADQMIWWVFNDNGGIHTRTTGDPIRMEVQSLAFGYKTGDEVNDMTFYRYKLINRANQTIDSTFFGQWVDADLGCYTDDLIGCDTSRSLAVIYNDGAVDGAGGCGSVPTYGNEVPLLGVDYFRGPKDEFGNELGMSSFVYYVNGGFPGNPATSDPTTGVEFYNYLSGSWRDGTPYTLGGDAYDANGVPTNYVFPDQPDNPNGWSMCTENVDGSDTRTVQASGPFTLEPGAINELIIGVAFVPDVLYPCPNLGTLLTADDLAQALYDNCFKITDGPDAPGLDIIELDKELIILMTNDSLRSNNYKLQYAERDLQAPDILPSGAANTDTNYVFEGYKLYQLADASFSDLDNPDEARLIFQVDVNNGIDKIYNWQAFPGTVATVPVFTPELMVDGGDGGIKSTFKVTEDQFADGERTLINHKQYYFVAVAYAYNNWQAYDPNTRVGQRKSYLEGRGNVVVTTGIPRIPTPEFGGLTLNAEYGDGVQITRYDGLGTGKNFLDLTDETVEAILASGNEDVLTYENGNGPIDVRVIDPLRLYPGDYSLKFFDEDMSNTQFDNNVRWVLTDPDGIQWFSETNIDTENEQLIIRTDENGESQTRGISITIGQVQEPGVIPVVEGNGLIGAEEEYTDPSNQWLSYVGADANFFGGMLDYVQTGSGQSDELRDPGRDFLNLLGGWHPYTLTTFRQPANAQYFFSPFWQNAAFGSVVQNTNGLDKLRNVDVVFTNDKSKWSKCVVVETATNGHTAEGWATVGNAENMDLRESNSVDKDGQDDGSGTVGYSWFPGYAIDVESGERLNIFFGENSIYSETNFAGFDDLTLNGDDMIWNPSDEFIADADGSGDITGLFEIALGGQHYIYVHGSAYDECETIHNNLSIGSAGPKVGVFRDLVWTAMPILSTNASLTSISEGLIPNDYSVKLRVANPYQVADPAANTDDNGYPSYGFSLDGQAPGVNDAETQAAALDLINVVPNPYYAYSAYEVQEIDNTVKITNLPPTCTVTIYSFDGRFIRQYKRAENPNSSVPLQGLVPEQMSASVEWDLKNSKAIPVASGVYLIHVNAPGIGERVIKWFGINRTFDTSGL